MRTGLLRGLVAATLAIAIGVAGPAQPAPATKTGVGANLMAFDWVGAVITVASSVLSGGGPSSGELQAAIQQITAAIDATRTEINNHIDAIANAEVQACVSQHTIELADIEFFSPSTLQRWAQNATGCATLATQYLQAVQSLHAADNIGFLIGEIHAIAIAARARAGFAITGLLQNSIDAYETVVSRIPGFCQGTLLGVGPGGPMSGNRYTAETRCTAHNGDTGMTSVSFIWPPASNPFDIEGAKVRASRNTSRPVAVDALPRLRAALG